MNELPSLIILKNSIISGKVPKESDLEIGELALSLYKGEESIWAKNSEGEIKNLRIPEPDLAWENLLVKFNTLEEFNNSLSSGLVNSKSIVFIEKEKMIWTDGVFYSTSYTLDEIQKIIEDSYIEVPQEIFNSSDSQEISDLIGGVPGFNSIIEKLKKGPTLTTIKTESTYIPVSIIEPEINSLLFEWIYKGEYRAITVTLDTEEGIFNTSNRSSIAFKDILNKQDTLISGENIKTINGVSLLGPGNISIEGGGSGGKSYIGKESETTITNVDNEINVISVNVKEDAIYKLISESTVDSLFDEIFINQPQK